MGRKSGYAEEEADAGAGAIDSAPAEAAAGKGKGSLLTTWAVKYAECSGQQLVRKLWWRIIADFRRTNHSRITEQITESG